MLHERRVFLLPVARRRQWCPSRWRRWWTGWGSSRLITDRCGCVFEWDGTLYWIGGVECTAAVQYEIEMIFDSAELRIQFETELNWNVNIMEQRPFETRTLLFVAVRC